MNKLFIGNKIMSMTPREAVCQYMGWDFSEASENRYHYGRTVAPIYSTPEGYVCAVANGKKPPNYDGLTWQEATGSTASFLKTNGKTVFVSSDEING